MNKDSPNTATSAEIFQVLDIVGVVDDIKIQLSQDYEGVFKQLEKIPAQTVSTLLDTSYVPVEDFLNCARYVQGVVDEILGVSPKQDISIIAELGNKLHEAIKMDSISLQSLTTSHNYLRVFCKKYPPRKMMNSLNPEYDDPMYHDPYSTVDAQDAVILGNDDRQVSPDEIKALFLIVEGIIQYAQVLGAITLRSSLDLETQKKCIENEQARITYVKKIKKELIKILSWGKSRTPYVALCEVSGPFGGDEREYILQNALQDLNTIFQQFSV